MSSHSHSQSSPGALANAFAAVRAVGFYLTTVAIAVPLFHVMLLLAPLVLLTDKFKRSAMHVVNDVWANLTSLLWCVRSWDRRPAVSDENNCESEE
jgi:hypothetical protein